ncbi:MAG: hypothetical protein JXR46_00505 [Calditrichaceae bacterium]|nr:hypothetical protein [Calditrichaceae bacterium]MBN2707494.1 hypothetical protein [Calditrichaceae bacterium]RQV95585.1 MAG: acyltransferase [Calditrichota bacterium]
MRLTDQQSQVKPIVRAIQSKWKLMDLVKSILFTPFYRLYFLVKNVKWQAGWRIYGKPVIHKTKGSKIVIGKNFTARSWFTCNPIGIDNPVFLTTWNPGAEIIIGDNVGVSGTVICSYQKITIGNNVMIGANARIFDTDFHPIDPGTRRYGTEDVQVSPVIIGDNVLIGSNSIVMKGVTIGENSIIGAGSIVVKDIPANCIAAGNPAKVIKEIMSTKDTDY